jgi:hypothetical protein
MTEYYKVNWVDGTETLDLASVRVSDNVPVVVKDLGNELEFRGTYGAYNASMNMGGKKQELGRLYFEKDIPLFKNGFECNLGFRRISENDAKLFRLEKTFRDVLDELFG